MLTVAGATEFVFVAMALDAVKSSSPVLAISIMLNAVSVIPKMVAATVTAAVPNMRSLFVSRLI